MPQKPFVVYWNNIPAPYMVERFNILAKRANLNFEAWFNDRTEPDRSWIVDESTWQFQYCYIKTFGYPKRRFHYPLPLLKQRRPDVMVSLYSEPSFLLGWTIAKLKGVKTGFRVVATSDRWIKRAVWKEALKKLIFPRVDFIVTEGKDGRKFSQHYGAAHERIFFARHGIDVAHFRDGSNIGRSERLQLRRKLCVKGITFIYVGRLLKLKGLDYLLDALKEVQHRMESEVSLLLVGDGTDEKFLRAKCKDNGICNVSFTGFCHAKGLPKMFAASDAFVFPTLGDAYGLVIDEAMACSLPVITTNAANEIHDRVEDGINGYIVPPGNSHALAEAMVTLAKNSDLRRRMGAISAKKINIHTHEKWVDDFEKIVFSMMNKP